MMRPRGRPPTPSAMSSPSEPVDTVSISTGFWPLPSRMIDPLPKARSICDRAASRAFVLSMDEPSTRRRADWDMGRVLMAGGRWDLKARPPVCPCFVLFLQEEPRTIRLRRAHGRHGSPGGLRVLGESGVVRDPDFDLRAPNLVFVPRHEPASKSLNVGRKL